ncbi:phosphatidylinositol 3 [Xylariaceae sp. FL0255]|nr:phosphatidylinositol 3 [Xylariaceae sp. FL0255]
MAPTSHGRNGHSHNGDSMDYEVPPPSTLAAQLVENISTSARSSGPDGTAELSNFLAVIEKAKNQTLVRKSERIEHNHLLIYVCVRVRLEGLKWDDPFADRAHLQAEIIRAIEFLKLTINEEPEVLLVVPDDGAFIFRGSEPLWLWIFPKVLKVLVNGSCLEIQTAVEALFEQIYLSASQTSRLWPFIPQFLAYLRHNLDAIQNHLKELRSSSVDRKASDELRLPQDTYFDVVEYDDPLSFQQRCTYDIKLVSQALQHALDLLSLLSIPLQADQPIFSVTVSFKDTIPWFIDACSRIYTLQDQWAHNSQFSTDQFLHVLTEIVGTINEAYNVDDLVQEKAFMLLAYVCKDLLTKRQAAGSAPLAAIGEDRALSLAFVKLSAACLKFQPIKQLVAAHIIPILDKSTDYEGLAGKGTDLWRSMDLIRRIIRNPLATDLTSVVQLDQFVDTEIKQFVQFLLPHTPVEPGKQEPKSKRTKTGQPQLLPKVIQVLWETIGEKPKDTLTGYMQALQNEYLNLNDADKARIIRLIAHLCCAADETLVMVSTNNTPPTEFDCPACRTSQSRSSPPLPNANIATKKPATELFASLLAIPGFSESRKPRVTAMVYLRRIARHYATADFYDLEVSKPAQSCLNSLQSGNRELRIAAGRTLAVFLTQPTSSDLKPELIQKNRKNAASILNDLSNQTRPELVESCILAWSHAAAAVSDDLLGFFLWKLVEFLGHSNSIASSTAFTEIINLAQRRLVTTRQLFEPFWPRLAIMAVKDMIEQPQLTKLLAQVIDTTVPQMLLHIQTNALPFLISDGKKDVIQKFAEARKENDLWQSCIDSANLGPILAHLLTLDSPNVEQHAMTLLRNVSEHFNQFNLADLLKMEPLPTALNLLKATADADESRKPQIRNALSQMAGQVLISSGEIVRKSHTAGRFLHTHALGLMARLIDVINDISLVSQVSLSERKRCIRAMEEMIRIGKNDVRIARPQISACTIAAMSHDELRSAAFSCWSAMIFYFDESELEILIETIFYLIGQYWAVFDDSSKQLSREIIDFFLTKQKDILESYIRKLPSFSHINELSDVEAKLSKLRSPVDSRTAFSLLAQRVCHENSGVVLQALRELVSYLERQQGYLQASAVSEKPDTIVGYLVKALLDCAARHNNPYNSEISDLCTQCIGLVGCLDSNRIEILRAENHMIVTSNFEDTHQVTEFVFFLLENVLVPKFVQVTETILQGFLSYAIQELLDRCGITEAVKNPNYKDAEPIYRRWCEVSPSAQEILSPFMTSKYTIAPMTAKPIEYPIFHPGKSYGNWLRNLTLDCLRRPQTPFATLIFEPLCRLIRVKDVAIAEFLFPYVIVHLILGDDIKEDDRNVILSELILALQHELPPDASYNDREDRKRYCEIVFQFLDYASRWVMLERALNTKETSKADRVVGFLESFPAELVSQRAMDCSAYPRALFHLEQHVHNVDESKDKTVNRDRLIERVQEIYKEIDEPDGLEGISAHLHVLDIEQQVLSHRKAGRWAAAQTWYEIKLAEDPNRTDIQLDLLTCLKESGQHDVLLNYVEGIEKHTAVGSINKIVPYAVEAAWATGRWEVMQKFINKYQGDYTEDFNVSIARALLCLQKGWTERFFEVMKNIRDRVGSSLSSSTTTNLESCHEPMLRAHVLTDLGLIVGMNHDGNQHPQEILKSLERRLEVVGSFVSDKQYILGIRRAAMDLLRPRFNDTDISSLWLSSARLARKANSMHQSFNAVLRASQFGDESATIENARLLWKDGHNRKAIQTLQGAIDRKVFSRQSFHDSDSFENVGTQQSLLTARAKLLLAKWLDNAGQTSATTLKEQYRAIPQIFPNWEKGHYYVGRWYKKVLESEKTLKPDDQTDEYLTGEVAKLVIENYLRSLNYGTKYLYQTLPRILTLWLELGASIDKAPEGKVSLSRELHHRRKMQLETLHGILRKNLSRLPAYIFYTAIPQLVARIAHPSPDVFRILQAMICKVVEAYPSQALWSLFAIMTSKQASSERRSRGQQILLHLKDNKSVKSENGGFSLPSLLRKGERLAEQLLLACNNGDFQSNRTTTASITRDLHFNHKCTPCPLVVPIEACLTATLPTLTDNMKRHKAFSRDVITIASFLDEVLVLGSLAKPRKLTARGSNGVNYGLMIKPKDDLRTDQRLMEFNSMINRSLKRDAESSRRQLYIRTYAVTPLNEECGIIEWMEGLKTMRDILLNIYRSRGIHPNYTQLQQMLKDSCIGDKNTKIFTEGVLGMFPPVLPHWFIAQFPDPSKWFNVRLRYTRSTAVMSMVGTILGLGDRHGENVLLEEGNGGIFHVDFNCLFDKGLTFAQPERVPFRLTHNMVAAMGIYGYEGPFRKCSELTLSILRQQEETLMTILEAFIYDPTLDLQKEKKKKHEVVKLNPQSVVESIRRKVRGLLPNESIPLGVEGQVDELIKQAVDPKNLAAMYIGWCPFL